MCSGLWSATTLGLVRGELGSLVQDGLALHLLSLLALRLQHRRRLRARLFAGLLSSGASRDPISRINRRLPWCCGRLLLFRLPAVAVLVAPPTGVTRLSPRAGDLAVPPDRLGSALSGGRRLACVFARLVARRGCSDCSLPRLWFGQYFTASLPVGFRLAPAGADVFNPSRACVGGLPLAAPLPDKTDKARAGRGLRVLLVLWFRTHNTNVGTGFVLRLRIVLRFRPRG